MCKIEGAIRSPLKMNELKRWTLPNREYQHGIIEQSRRECGLLRLYSIVFPSAPNSSITEVSGTICLLVRFLFYRPVDAKIVAE